MFEMVRKLLRWYTPESPKPVETDSSSKHLLVAAIDFGTTYSGYAFSFRDTPEQVQTNASWNSGGIEGLLSWKTPTCVLANRNQEFLYFGYEAENKYVELTDRNEHHGMLFFRRFKMLLGKSEPLSRTMTIEDINGVSMPAKTIFVWSISYMKRHLLNALHKQVLDIEESDIKYVLTVPAIWNDGAKQFMREAAVEAGIKEENLKLALEPEAASIWCQNLKKYVRSQLSKAGTQYMVVDLGGGTADISVHEKQTDNTLKELHIPSGGPWGGNAVDDNFIQWLTGLFGQETIKRFKTEQMEDYFGLLRDFEIKKRKLSVDTTGNITFRLSVSLKEIFEEVENMSFDEKAAFLQLNEEISFVSDKFRVNISVMKDFFSGPVKSVVSEVKKILDDPKMKKVETVILVGGFGECELVQHEMKKHVKYLITPDQAGLVVLKGAVRFGHLPKIISSRIMPFTYGIAVSEYYDKNKHRESQVVIKNNVKLVDNIFRAFVHIKENVEVAKPIHRSNIIPTDLNKTCLKIYKSTNPDPKFITDEGCDELGTLTIEHPEGDKLKDKMFDVIFVFGDTELLVKAKILNSGREFSTYIDCLK